MSEPWRDLLVPVAEVELPIDLWSGIEQRAAGLRSGKRDRARFRQPVGWILAGAGCVLVLAALAVAAHSRSNSPGVVSPGPGGGGGSYRDPGFGWTIRYPRGLRAGHFASNGARAVVEGEWVANFDANISGSPTTTSPGSNSVPNWTRLRTFPSHGVALAIWYLDAGIQGPPPLQDSHFPVLPQALRPVTPYVGGSEPTPRYALVYGDGTAFAAAVWIGPHAPAAARRAIWATLASLRFPPLHESTIRAHSFYVLGDANSYPLGSVTYIAASTLPISKPYLTTAHGFYLVHAPRAFYAISDTFTYPTSDNTCPITYNSSTKQFTCAATSLRWNRNGQLLLSPNSNAGTAGDWNLGLHIATIAQDGHVLYNPSFGALLPLRLKGDPWATQG